MNKKVAASGRRNATTTKEAPPEVVVVVDLTLPISKRPMIGLDVENWRAQRRLSKRQAENALGFRNAAHYKRVCDSELAPYCIELLVRIYEELPDAPGFDCYTPRQLFEMMYGAKVDAFRGLPSEVPARVDIRARFTKMFARSHARAYQWLDESEISGTNSRHVSAYADVECILAKLKQAKDPVELFERLAKKVWALRGVDLDKEYRIPTPDSPPTREKSGRKVGVVYPRKVQDGQPSLKTKKKVMAATEKPGRGVKKSVRVKVSV